jgi:RecB family exonuclease
MNTSGSADKPLMGKGGYLSDITDALAQDPLGEKVFILPAFSAGHQIGEALAGAGVSWVNLRFLTLPSLALQAAGPSLAAAGFRSLTEAAARVRIHRILHDLRREDRLRYFGDLELKPGLIAAFHRSIGELRSAGISGDGLRHDHFFNRDKGRDWGLILERYEAMLEEGRFFDRAGLYRAAVSACTTRTDKTRGAYFCLDSQIFSTLEKEFLLSLAGDRLRVLARGIVHGLARPRLYHPLSPHKARSSEPGSDLEGAPWLFALRNRPAPRGDGSIAVFHSLGVGSECREVLRRITVLGAGLDEVEILCPPGSLYVSHFFDLAKQLDFPVTFEEGIPVAYTSPGRLYLGLINWMEGGFSESLFRPLIREGLLKLPGSSSGEALSASSVIRILRRAKIGWGRMRYKLRLEALRKEILAGKADVPETDQGRGKKQAERADNVNLVASWMESILAFFPVWEDGAEGEWGGLCTGLAGFLKKYARVADGMDGEALGLLSGRLEETAAALPPPSPREDVFEWLAGLASINVGASGPLPGRIHISSYEGGGFSGRTSVFIVGVDQTAVPGSPLPDPLLLDGERKRIAESLTLSSDRQRERLFSMTALLASLKGRVTLSYPAYDPLKERPGFPSSFLLQVHRLLKGDPELDYSSFLRALGPPEGFVPAVPLDERDWWLHRIAPGGLARDALAAVMRENRGIARGHEARRGRCEGAAGPYDGIVVIPPEEIHPLFNSEMLMSASRLENLARCPFGYFLRYVLDLAPPEEALADPAVWLDPLQRGALLHEIFCFFMEDLQKRGEGVDTVKHGPVIRRVADELIARYREEIPAPSEAVVERDRAEVHQSLDIFLRMEQGREEPVSPLLFEVTFGTEEAEPVLLDLGEGRNLRIAGRIDRIDRMEGGGFRVIDYKTGSPRPYENVRCFGGGRYLQAALYAVAAEELLRRRGVEGGEAKVKISGYAFPSKKGDGREILFGNIDGARLRSLITDLLKMVEGGHFVVHPAASCDFCDYRPLCGPQAAGRAKMKKAGGSPGFAELERLEDYD